MQIVHKPPNFQSTACWIRPYRNPNFAKTEADEAKTGSAPALRGTGMQFIGVSQRNGAGEFFSRRCSFQAKL